MKAKKRKVKKPVVSTQEGIVAEQAPVSQSAAAVAPVAARPRRSDAELDRVWFYAAAAITALAAFLRFFWLELKVLHHDEGVNAFFLKTLFNEGIYKYDPANYHGPVLYYISLAFAKIFGFEAVPLRMSMAIFGLLIVVLALFLRRYLGRVGSLVAALFLALSPGMVFISRYFIHEILFVFLSMAIVVAVVYFIDKRKAGPFAIFWMALLLLIAYLPSTIKLAAALGGENRGAIWALRIVFFIIQAILVYLVIRLLLSWDEGRPIYLILASSCTALFFGTKETAFITLGTFIIACVCVWIWRKVMPVGVLAGNMFKVVVAAHVAVVAVLIYFRQHLIDGWDWLIQTFEGTLRPPEHFVFISIIFLTLTALAAWFMFLYELRQSNETELAEPVDLTWGGFRSALGTRKNIILISAAVATAFAYLTVLFFSSFFTYAEGIGKAFEAYAIWTKTGNKDHTMHGYVGYIKWGTKLEAPILILSLLGVFVAMFKARHRFAMFTALWAGGLFAAYTIIPYKTPWLALSFILPMCLIAGYGINELLIAKNIRLRAAAIALTIIGSTVLAYQMYQLNVVRYDDDDMPYVYAHSRRELLNMVEQIDYYAQKSGKGAETVIEIVSPDYWPLTWYMNKYNRAGFHGRLVDVTASEVIVAKKKDQDAEVMAKYSNHYKFIGVYPLRPGVDLTLLIRNDLADPTAMDMSRIPEFKPN